MSPAIHVSETNSTLEELHDQLYTNHEVAEFLHKNHKTVTSWARQGRFPKGSVIENGGNRLYKLELIIRGFQSNYDKGGSREILRLKSYEKILEEIHGKYFLNQDIAYIFRKDIRTIDSWARQKRFPSGSVLRMERNCLFRLDLILKRFERSYNEKRVRG